MSHSGPWVSRPQGRPVGVPAPLPPCPLPGNVFKVGMGILLRSREARGEEVCLGKLSLYSSKKLILEYVLEIYSETRGSGPLLLLALEVSGRRGNLRGREGKNVKGRTEQREKMKDG